MRPMGPWRIWCSGVGKYMIDVYAQVYSKYLLSPTSICPGSLKTTYQLFPTQVPPPSSEDNCSKAEQWWPTYPKLTRLTRKGPRYLCSLPKTSKSWRWTMLLSQMQRQRAMFGHTLNACFSSTSSVSSPL